MASIMAEPLRPHNKTAFRHVDDDQLVNWCIYVVVTGRKFAIQDSDMNHHFVPEISVSYFLGEQIKALHNLSRVCDSHSRPQLLLLLWKFLLKKVIPCI